MFTFWSQNDDKPLGNVIYSDNETCTTTVG